jgi:hypothetical protein
MGNADSKAAVSNAETSTVPSSSDSNKERTAEQAPKRHRQAIQTRDDEHSLTQISEEQVTVNLAMSDLMAYLQVVANNSHNLPITRRDDPDIKASVSSLSAEEYAKKSAAFVPADVRMLGGIYTRYGKVLDLPSSDVSTFLPKFAHFYPFMYSNLFVCL